MSCDRTESHPESSSCESVAKDVRTASLREYVTERVPRAAQIAGTRGPVNEQRPL